MARDTKGAFDASGAHTHEYDWKRAGEIHKASIKERERLHQEGIAKRKAARMEAAAAKRNAVDVPKES